VPAIDPQIHSIVLNVLLKICLLPTYYIKGEFKMSTTENKALVQRFMAGFQTVRDTRDTSLLEEVMAPDVALHMTGFPPEMQGRDAFVQGLYIFINAFPDLQITELSPMLAQDDMVALRVCWSGTHTGDLMGIAATGKRVAVADMHVERIADGKIVERFVVSDMMGLLQQIGVIPAPQQA
jgi:steroid delta-isomerase-like uncharacterized protein